MCGILPFLVSFRTSDIEIPVRSETSAAERHSFLLSKYYHSFHIFSSILLKRFAAIIVSELKIEVISKKVLTFDFEYDIIKN